MSTTSGWFAADHVDGLATVGGHADDVDPAGLSTSSQPGADQVLVVGDHHAVVTRRRRPAGSARRARTRPSRDAVRRACRRAAPPARPCPSRPRPAAVPARRGAGAGWSRGSRSSVGRAVEPQRRRSVARSLSALVSASCTIRYADTSTPAGSVPAAGRQPRSTSSPPARNSSTSAGRSASPGAGAQAELVGVVADHVQQSAGLGERLRGRCRPRRRAPARPGRGRCAPGPARRRSAPPSR